MEGEIQEEIKDKRRLSQVMAAPKVSWATDDSGYSSDVFATPEVSRKDVKGTSTFTHPYSTPYLTRRSVNRLTSTPHSSASQDVLRLSTPKLGALDVSQASPSNSTIGSSCSTLNDLTECELEVACLGSSNIPSSVPQNKYLTPEQKKSPISIVQPKLSVECEEKQRKKSQSRNHSPIKEQIKSFAVRQKASISRVITRRRTSQWVFVRMLQEAEYLAIRVLKYLSGSELLQLSHVNTQLRMLILSDKVLGGRRTAYITRRRKEKDHVGKENYTRSKKCMDENDVPASFGTLSPRKHLSAIHNLNPPSPTKAPAVIKPTLSEKFIEEGRKLPKDEQLQKCPKCKSPARVLKDQHRATCSCGYDYCTRCFLTFHQKPKECPVLKPRTRTGGGGIFSNKCKKSLRRL